MQSPITGKPMKRIEINVGTKVGYMFIVTLQEFWLCEDSNQTFCDTEMMQINLDKVNNGVFELLNAG